jgi:hypothetical protein
MRRLGPARISYAGAANDFETRDDPSFGDDADDEEKEFDNTQDDFEDQIE